MFKKFKILKEAADKLYPYFIPSYNNCVRTIGLASSIVLLPLASTYIPTIFLSQNNLDSNTDEDNANNMNLLIVLAGVSTVALLNGVQQALSTMLTTSTMQAMKEHNVQLLMDKSQFLMHGNTRDVTSLQYVTVGVGVRSFAMNAVPIFTALPMYIISSISTLLHISYYTESAITSGIVLCFVTTSGIATYLLATKYFVYNTNNQNIENDLVARVAFIESHRDAISLMNTSSAECSEMMNNLQKINSTIPQLSLVILCNTLLVSLVTSVASQFLGSYYTEGTIKDLSDPNARVLNVMIMSLLNNVQYIALILTENYSYVELNLQQLRAFDKAHIHCTLNSYTHNRMTQEFDGDKFSLIDFSIYKPNFAEGSTEPLIALFNNIRLELLPNKIYKLSAESGAGKTTFLKAITNNWQYTDGTVKFPESAKGNICFIPQHSFIPRGTLLEILLYPLKFQKPLVNDSSSVIMDEYKMYLPINSNDEEVQIGSSVVNILQIMARAKHLLKVAKLLPCVIKNNELESENINWNERLSGGEKQKLGIIRAILTDSTFIIMDEATSALDIKNKQIIYEMVKENVMKLENYIVIYTDHDSMCHFGDVILTITGQGLESSDY